MMVEQAAAKAKRKFVRVQISPETDEDDLIGGYRLENGDTVFSKGPVVRAMEEGALLLLDEIDRGSNKLMCLQSVLEGKPVLLKKTGETITPAPGFNVIATANTKGRGSDDGRFTAANIIDDAFLERFLATLDQPWPTKAPERKILGLHAESESVTDNDFLDKLVDWAWVIRRTFDDGGVDEVVSTRRLCHIVKCYSILGDRLKAIKAAISRFDEDSTAPFLSLWDQIDAGRENFEVNGVTVNTTSEDEAA
jgi:MoxR-like ATPase